MEVLIMFNVKQEMVKKKKNNKKLQIESFVLVNEIFFSFLGDLERAKKYCKNFSLNLKQQSSLTK
jgi:hypothetical protein